MSNKGSIGVVGAGVVGLSSALLLADAGYKVTIMARNIAGDDSTEWASPWAGALLAPYPGGDADMQRESLKHYAELKQDVSAGIKDLHITGYYDDRDDASTIWYKNMYPDFEMLPPSEIPSHAKIGYKYTGLVVNPLIFLPWLIARLESKGVKIIRTTLKSLDEARKLSGAEIIVNASGLGAAELAQDTAVQSIRGQTMFVKCDYDHTIIFQGSEYTYVIPRPFSGGVILGGISQKNSTDPKVQDWLKKDILTRINKITDNAFAWVDPDKHAQHIVGFRPAREGGIRVEKEGNTVHAYGAAGLGFLYAFGMAQEVKKLVELKARI